MGPKTVTKKTNYQRSTMRALTALVSASALIHSATASTYKQLEWKYTSDELIVSACNSAITFSATFCESQVQKKSCSCTNVAALGSMLNCLYNETSVNNEGIESEFIGHCSQYGVNFTSEILRSAYENATKYIINPFTEPSYNKSIPINRPVYYPPDGYELSYKSYKADYQNERDQIYLGAACMGYWAVIFFVATLYNFGSKIGFVGRFFNQAPFRLARQYISMPALFSKYHNEEFYPFGKKIRFIAGLVPTRIESLIIFLWFVMVVLAQSLGYHSVKGTILFATNRIQMAGFIGNRAGVLAVYGFVLTFLFAGRNNFLLWLTGWRQATFVTYHKWVSRINILLLVAHVTCKAILMHDMGISQVLLKLEWIRFGIVSATCAFCIFIFASYWFRRNHYELFLMTHILLVVFFLVGTFKHIKELDFQNWAFSMIGIWCFDRLVRLLRLVAFGVQSAQATIVSGETIKLRIPKRHFWKTFPGAYGYIHFIRPTTFIQSHPFTIVSDSHDEVTFYVRIKGGVTSHAHQYLASQPGKTGTLRVSVEGPYGDPKHLNRYDTALLYAGGNGIPGMYAYAKQLTEKANVKVKLYWVIRNWHSIDWFYEELLKLEDTHVELIIYVTNPDSNVASRFEEVEQTSSDSIQSEKNESHRKMSAHLSFIDFRFGRPNLEEIIKSDLIESPGNVAIMTCAHPKMTDDVRHVVKDNLDVASGRVDLFEELQVW